MSTKANIIVQNGDEKLWFYRHSDGSPESAMPLLEKFLSMVKDGQIRDNVGQAAGWLILLGAAESYPCVGLGDAAEIGTWKCGSIEPVAWGQQRTWTNGDIEYLYTVDLGAKTIRIQKIEREEAMTICRDKYKELLYHVETRCPGESRHETALRYIREAEARAGGCGSEEKAPAREKDEPA